jgi:hypothetical protein
MDNFGNKLIYHLPKSKGEINPNKIKINSSPYLEYPEFRLGFQHFLHQSKDKMEILESFKGKKPVYNVTNKFEIQIDEYDDSIYSNALKYIPIPKNMSHIDYSFFALWEIYSLFNIFTNSSSSIVHLNEISGNLYTSTALYRMNSGNKTDKTAVFTNNKNLPSPSVGSSKIKIIKDMNSTKILNEIVKMKNIDVIVSDLELSLDNSTMQETKLFGILLKQISIAFQIQKKGGCLICRIGETFTQSTMSLIQLLTTAYSDTYIIKPLTVKPSSSEKFIVCKGFTEFKGLDKISSMLFSLSKNNLSDCLTGFQLQNEPGSDLIKTMTLLNSEISNSTFIALNKIVAFIESQNYHGDVYHNLRDEQIKATKTWINLFFPKNKKDQQKINEKFLKGIIDFNSKKIVEVDV